MLYVVRCNPFHRLYGAYLCRSCQCRLLGLALVAQRYTCDISRCRTSQYRRAFYCPFCISVERSSLTLIRWCWICGFYQQRQCFFIGPYAARSLAHMLLAQLPICCSLNCPYAASSIAHMLLAQLPIRCSLNCPYAASSIAHMLFAHWSICCSLTFY